MVQFCWKHWNTQIFPKDSTLNQLEITRKNCQRHPTNLIAKQSKTTTATCPMTLNCQTYLKRLLKRFCLASIPAKPLEFCWNKFQQDFWMKVQKYWFLLWETINSSVKLSTFPEECKIAKSKPIFKKGARTVPKI